MNTFISHHGIIGQRWGKRNGPPYPSMDIKAFNTGIKQRIEFKK